MTINKINPAEGENISGVHLSGGFKIGDSNRQCNLPINNRENELFETCCGGGGGSSDILGSGCIVVGGDPTTVSLPLSPDLGNVLDCRTNGLYASASGAGTDPTVVDVVDTDCIDLTISGAGTAGDPRLISAALILNPAADNILQCTANGMYVPQSCPITVEAGTSAAVGDNSGGSELMECGDTLHFWSSDSTINVAVAPGSVRVDHTINLDTITAGNALTTSPLGLYVSEVDGSETIVNAGTNISITGTGTSANPYIVNASGAAGFACADLNTCPISSLQDVNTVGAINGSVLKYNGSIWVAGTDVGGGAGDNWGIQTVVSDGTLTGDGTAATPLSANVTLAETPGLCNAFDITSDANNNFTIDFVVNPSASNQLSCGPAGVYSAPPIAAIGDCVSVQVDNTGSPAVISADIILNTVLGDNMLSCGVQGLYVPPTSVSAGTNVSVTGNGTAGNPYVINSTGGVGGFSCTDLNACSIDALSDVNVGAALPNQLLVYNGTNWFPATFTLDCDAVKACLNDSNQCADNILSNRFTLCQGGTPNDGAEWEMLEVDGNEFQLQYSLFSTDVFRASYNNGITFYNAYKFPASTGLSGQVLQLNAAADTLEWSTIAGATTTNITDNTSDNCISLNLAEPTTDNFTLNATVNLVPNIPDANGVCDNILSCETGGLLVQPILNVELPGNIDCEDATDVRNYLLLTYPNQTNAIIAYANGGFNGLPQAHDAGCVWIFNPCGGTDGFATESDLIRMDYGCGASTPIDEWLGTGTFASMTINPHSPKCQKHYFYCLTGNPNFNNGGAPGNPNAVPPCPGDLNNGDEITFYAVDGFTYESPCGVIYNIAAGEVVSMKCINGFWFMY